jgi:hypothetical protein
MNYAVQVIEANIIELFQARNRANFFIEKLVNMGCEAFVDQDGILEVVDAETALLTMNVAESIWRRGQLEPGGLCSVWGNEAEHLRDAAKTFRRALAWLEQEVPEQIEDMRANLQTDVEAGVEAVRINQAALDIKKSLDRMPAEQAAALRDSLSEFFWPQNS